MCGHALRDNCSVRGQPDGPKGGITSSHTVLCHVASISLVFTQSLKREFSGWITPLLKYPYSNSWMPAFIEVTLTKILCDFSEWALNKHLFTLKRTPCTDQRSNSPSSILVSQCVWWVTHRDMGDSKAAEGSHITWKLPKCPLPVWVTSHKTASMELLCDLQVPQPFPLLEEPLLTQPCGRDLVRTLPWCVSYWDFNEHPPRRQNVSVLRKTLHNDCGCITENTNYLSDWGIQRLRT